MYDFNWQTIRAWNGSQYNGFEELCVQLARLEAPEGAEFIATGNPDAGVECYCVLADKNEWGWQAKYFTARLTNPQWQQLDGSVKTALDKHPRLVRYYVCIPRDRSDARSPKRSSEMDRWNDHVSKWEGWAQDRGLNVEFVWWGSFEIVERLSRNENIGRRFFWFGQRGFDHDWFRYHLDEAVGDARPRYTPEVHVDLPIAQDMERFSRSSFLFDEVKSLAIGIRRAHSGLMSAGKSLDPSVQGTDIDDLSKTTGAVLDTLAKTKPSPIGLPPFADIARAANKANEIGAQVEGRFWQLQREQEARSQGGRTSRSHYPDPFQDILYHLQRLTSGLREVVETCNHADSLATSQILLLKGDGGTGKTHLLCDFAKKRINAQLPTVLLLGQWFRSEDDPWVQLLQKLDLAGNSAEEFVGALEAAAQASDCRALVMIDALNEGNGRNIWLPHLSAFLARLEKSPWIGVVLSVRSSYEKVVVPENVQGRAAGVTHYGFDDHEYDAVQTFFSHYGLEFPSAPILQPEFRNPLFLKTICKGLQDKGERRIPRGFHGITAVFNLYLETVSRRLAADLDYNPRDNLVRGALDSLSKLLVETECRWLSRPLAEQVVNDLLPGRDFSNSLYRGLVTEGVLVEDRGWRTGNTGEEMVFISYDRFADHVIADFLLRTHLNIADPEAAFADGGGLAFLQEGKAYVPQGLIEALCVQVPEHTGQELVRLAPEALHFRDIGDAFLESIVWRKPDAFSEDTRAVLSELIEADKVRSDPLDALLTVSTVPDHPFNADFLEQRLRKDIMPDRDAWWSTYLHRVWGTQGPVDRLVDWASSLSADDYVEDSVVDLSATTLAWTFTTPNRFLRDRATKALVSLLTGRLESTVRLVDRFADVDDPYVTERVYAVAYGTAMRSYDLTAVGKLASSVFQHIFASGTPPAHILLRDYARGVVERAIYLGCNLELDERLVQSPYRSLWPSIPCEDCIEELFPYWGQTSWDSRDPEWSKNRIRRSVLDDDFSHYVIGDDSLSSWLALRLDEEPWQSPEERRQAWILELSKSERLAWEEFVSAKASVLPMAYMRPIELADESSNVVETLRMPTIQVDEEAAEQARMKLDLAYKQMMEELTEEHRGELECIEDDRDGRQGPRFDKRLIQRYILWRVFDLGWTTERFGVFDRFSFGYSGRAAAKPERIGKKYQWIAYHEILAYIADQYQYRETYGGEYSQRRYEGPWQELLRDIDPSCTLKSTPGGTSWGPHNPSWWGEELYGAWQENSDHKDWIVEEKDVPAIEQLLAVVKPEDGSHWLNVNGSFVWRQPHPTDQEPYDQNRRDMWIGITGYFLPAGEAEAFMTWAESVDFWEGWMPEPHSLSAMSSTFLGEYGWAPAFKHSCLEYLDFEDWVKPTSRDGKECPVPIQPVSLRYLSESRGFDCSVEDDVILYLPHQEFISHLGLQWSCSGADYLDTTGEVAVFDPTVHEDGPTALLLRKDLLLQYLQDKGLTLCWTILGEKWVVGGDASEKYHGRLKMSGAYRQMGSDQVGFLNYVPDIPKDDADDPDAVQDEEVSDMSSPGS